MNGEAEEAADELKIRLIALPAALAIAALFQSFELGKSLQRIFFGMWLHELGHATAAWLCGFPAFPGPWLTPMSTERSWPFAIALSAALGWFCWRARHSEQRPWLKWVLGAVLVLQLGCTLLTSNAGAQKLILFAGDGGALVFGTLAMAAIFAPPGSVLHRGWLRFGVLVIGAAAFTDVFAQWWGARTDFDRIPFGMNEGVGLSDSSRLVDEYGWTARQLVDRYLRLGVGCAVALAGLYVTAVLRAKKALVNHP